MQILTSTGFGDSGSSAITDLLSEYEGIKNYGSEWECTFLHMPDGLGDLESAIQEGHRLKVDYAINRFLKLSKILSEQENYKKAFKGKFWELSVKFVNDISEIIWNGMYEERQEKFNNELTKKEKKYIQFSEAYYKLSKSKNFEMYESDSWRPNYVPFTNMYYGCDIQKFYESAKKYTSELFALASENQERLYLDQLVPPISVNKYLNYFSNEVKVFIVDKDPRDLFLVEKLFNGSRFIPYENVETYIKWYKATREKSLESNKDKTIYRCKLDDLIFDYENQCKKIENFVGLTSESHTKKMERFNPEKSKVNIQLYNKYDNYGLEIARIEKDLQSFLSTPDTYVNGVDKNNPNNHFNNPVTDVIKICDEIQKGKIRYKKIKIAVYSTIFIKNCFDFNERKTFIKKIKGLIKILIGLIIFIPNFFFNLYYEIGM